MVCRCGRKLSERELCPEVQAVVVEIAARAQAIEPGVIVPAHLAPELELIPEEEIVQMGSLPARSSADRPGPLRCRLRECRWTCWSH